MKEEPTEVTNQTLIEIANTDMKTKTDEVLDKKTAKTDTRWTKTSFASLWKLFIEVRF